MVEKIGTKFSLVQDFIKIVINLVHRNNSIVLFFHSTTKTDRTEMDPKKKVYFYVYNNQNEFDYSKQLPESQIYGYLSKNENNDLVHCCFECHVEFINSSVFEEHVSGFCTKLDALDGNCMDNILKYLPIEDQIAMSLTSRRNEDLVESYLYRNYKGQPLRIIDWKSLEFDFESSDKEYKDQFTKLCPSIELIKKYNGPTSKDFEFIRDNCAKRLKYMKISAFRWIRWTDDVGEIIKPQLEHVHELHLEEVWFHRGPQTLLNHCKNLSALNIKVEDKQNESLPNYLDKVKCMQLLCNRAPPKFETLTLDIPEEFRLDLAEFFRLNTKLKTFQCTNNSSIIKSMLDADNTLRDVILEFSSPEAFQAVQSDIQKWVDKDNRKDLDVFKIDYDQYLDENLVQNIEFILNLPLVTEAHFWLPDQMLLNSAGTRQSRIKKLHLSGFSELSYNPMIWNQLQDFAPDLEEIKYEFRFLNFLGINDYMENIHKSIIKATLRRFKKLQELVFIGYNDDIAEGDLAEFNQIRSQLRDATKVTLQLATDFTDFATSEDGQVILKPFQDYF